MTPPRQMRKEQVRALWESCFHEQECFLDLYFSLRYTPQVNKALWVNESPVAALQLLPYNLCYEGLTAEAGYISGACTHPQHQRKGYMRLLLSQTMQQMHQKEVPFAMLIPADTHLQAYYTKADFVPVFRRGWAKMPLPREADLPHTVVEKLGRADQQTAEYMLQAYYRLPCAVTHTAQDLEMVMADLALDKGGIIVAKRQGNLCGMAAFTAEPQPLLKELLTDDQQTCTALLQSLQKMLGRDTVTQMLTDGRGTPAQPGMIRITHAEKALNLWAETHPGEQLHIALTDPFLPQNNGYYQVAQGQCLRKEADAAIKARPMDVQKLTHLLFAHTWPHMTLMVD